MIPFLKIVADDLYAHLGGNFERVSVVFPNKRASLFFERHLAELMDGKIWAPTYHSLDDIFERMSDKIVADPIMQVCLLYKAHQAVAHYSGSLSQFYGWGEVMLSDFNDIDNNMALADKVLANVKDLEDLKVNDYFSEGQLEALRTYFENYDPAAQTELKRKFQDIWSTLYPTYCAFRQLLAEQHVAYGGMLKREVVEQLERRRDDDAPAWLKGRTFVFVGFNVLNNTERRLFMQLRRYCKVLFYWDYDKGYCAPNAEATNEAGRFIRENLADFPNKLDHPDIDLGEDIYDNFSKPKRIRMIETSTEVQQARYAGNFLKQGFAPGEALNETAIVLCNEGNLQPVLHSIPSRYQELTPDGAVEHPLLLNITMGYPLMEMPIASLLLLLVEMQQRGRTTAGWRHRYVLDVLAHPYAKYAVGNAAEELRQAIISERKYIVADADPAIEACKQLFRPTTDNVALLTYLADVTQHIGLAMRQATTEQQAHEALPQLYAESVFVAYKLLNRLVSLSQLTIDGAPLLDVNDGMLLHLLRTLLRSRTIPFHGEPAEGVQVLGLLETRNIDFRRVVMLAVNEGTLPGKEQRASFIPYNLREAYGMTTMERQISLSAYYYYRLLSRAEEIVLLYNVAAEAGQTGEMSRFLVQLLAEHAPNEPRQTLLSKQTTIERLKLDTTTSAIVTTPLSAKKDDFAMRRLMERYDFSATEGQHADHAPTFFSPSALNAYINCPMQFYFQYVVGLREEDELSEEVDNRIFGTLLHGCMELLYAPFTGRGDIQSDTLLAMAADNHLLETTVDKAFARDFFNVPKERLAQYVPNYNGEQLITRSVILEYVKKQLRYDARCCPMQILGVETKRYEHIIELPLADGRSVSIKLGGIIDRLDDAMHAKVRNDAGNWVRSDAERYVRVVDYKTSASAQTTSTLEALFDTDTPKRAYHILQTFYYCYVLAQSADFKGRAIKPQLMYVKTLSDDADPCVSIGKEPIENFAVQQVAGASLMPAFIDMLKAKLTEIFDTSVAFTQTTRTENCAYCAFKQMCGR